MRLFVIGAIFILSAVTLVTVGILSSGIRRFELKDLFDTGSGLKPGETIVVDNGQIVAIESLSPNLVFKYATEQQPADSNNAQIGDAQMLLGPIHDRGHAALGHRILVAGAHDSREVVRLLHRSVDQEIVGLVSHGKVRPRNTFGVLQAAGIVRAGGDIP